MGRVSAQLTCRVQGPVRVVQQLSSERDEVDLALFGGPLGQPGIPQQADADRRDACFPFDPRCERQLVAVFEDHALRAFASGDAAGGAVDGVDAEGLQAPGEVDSVLDLPAVRTPVGERQPEDQRKLLRPDVPVRCGDLAREAASSVQAAPVGVASLVGDRE